MATRASLPNPQVLVTLPVYNEAAILGNSVESVLRALSDSGIDFRLSIAEDGSTDGTQNCVREILKRHPTIIAQSNVERRGRGWALRTLWSRVDADFYAFSDADFAADPHFLVEAIKIATAGRAVVTGSRYVPGATTVRPPLRHLVSKGYNRLTRLLFHDHVSDHQCGLKVFSREALHLLLPISREDTWFWDTEVLILANELGLGITEFPVAWTERKSTSTNVLRLASDVFIHGTGLLRLKGYQSSRPFPERIHDSLEPVRTEHDTGLPTSNSRT